MAYIYCILSSHCSLFLSSFFIFLSISLSISLSNGEYEVLNFDLVKQFETFKVFKKNESESEESAAVAVDGLRRLHITLGFQPGVKALPPILAASIARGVATYKLYSELSTAWVTGLIVTAFMLALASYFTTMFSGK
ncbi:hypothetical protein TWF696_009482 [Orbilia brochopaga]|uniref:Uncharacterized protein n=1 Tax=Orbilia brochopaga TaxID=3140254 RepID=A0AAV9UBF7_9PEZI